MMSGKTTELALLEAIGVSRDEILERIVAKAVERLFEERGFDEDGEPFIAASRLTESLITTLLSAVDEKVAALGETHVVPIVNELIEGHVLQETNKWGERVGSPLTFKEYLVSRADAYIKEPVDFEGKTKGEMRSGSYHTWRQDGTRIEHLIGKYLNQAVEKAVKAVIAKADAVIQGGFEQSIREQLRILSEELVIDIKHKSKKK